ncbi:hypothetical protein Bca101_073000 [Brassica carinata]
MNQVYSKIKSVERVNTVIRGREQQGAKTAFDVKKRIWKRREKQVMYGVQKEYPEWWGEQKRQAGRGGGRGGRGRGGMTIRANAVQAAGAFETSAEAKLEDQKQGTRWTGKSTNLEWFLNTKTE